MSLQFKGSLEKFAEKFYMLAQQLQTSNSMDLNTAKATLLSAVYDNKPLHCHLFFALPNCHNLKAIKESMIEIRSSFTGEKSSCTPVGVPQGKGKSAILTTETK